MDLYDVLDQIAALLQRRGRVTYNALKLQFSLDDDKLAVLTDELLYAHPQVVEDAGRGLRWKGAPAATPAPRAPQHIPSPVSQAEPAPQGGVPAPEPRPPEAERRQLTVLFCDLVESTALAARLDPEELREVVRAYQETCARVIERFDGHIAQYLGDGLLVYFGYPQAHEDDAHRAVRTGLGIVEAMGKLNARSASGAGGAAGGAGGRAHRPGGGGRDGGGARREALALGETPNLAARLQGLAEPDTVVISPATARLIQGYFECRTLGAQTLKGIAQPLEVSQVLCESGAKTRLDAAGAGGLTPLVGRDEELEFLLCTLGTGQRRARTGCPPERGSRDRQVASGAYAASPGGQSAAAWLTPCQCLAHYQNSTLYPIIDLLERVVLALTREESPQQKLRKLEGWLVQYGFSLPAAVPLFASLLSLPFGAGYASLDVTPAQHKHQTLQAILTALLKRAAQQPMLL
jgi:class 3 adenylate cyclase